MNRLLVKHDEGENYNYSRQWLGCELQRTSLIIYASCAYEPVEPNLYQYRAKGSEQQDRGVPKHRLQAVHRSGRSARGPLLGVGGRLGQGVHLPAGQEQEG